MSGMKNIITYYICLNSSHNINRLPFARITGVVGSSDKDLRGRTDESEEGA
jgi:hypothetical protein